MRNISLVFIHVLFFGCAAAIYVHAWFAAITIFLALGIILFPVSHNVFVTTTVILIWTSVWFALIHVFKLLIQ